MNPKKTTILYILIILLVVLIVFGVCAFGNQLCNKYFLNNPIPHGSFPQFPFYILDIDKEIIASPIGHGSIGVLRTKESLIGFDIYAGKILWQSTSSYDDLSSIAPIVADDSVIAIENDSAIAVFSLDSGEFLWRDAPNLDSVPDDGITGKIEGIGYSTGFVFVARARLSLTAYNIRTGEITWQEDFSTRSTLFLDIDSQTVYLNKDKTLSAYDILDGSNIFNISYPGMVGPLVKQEEDIYSVTYEDTPTIVVVNTSSLESGWTAISKQLEGKIQCLRVDGNILYVAGTYILALDRFTGDTLWVSENIGPLGCPILYKDRLYTRSRDGRIYEFKKLDGKLSGWLQVRVNSINMLNPELDPFSLNGILIVPFGDSRVFAYKP